MRRDFEVSDGAGIVMRLPSTSYGALYQAGVLDRVIEHVKGRNVAAAWTVVNDAIVLCDSLECPWCDRLGLHDDCWAPRTTESR
jgi:hypothetical protein